MFRLLKSGHFLKTSPGGQGDFFNKIYIFLLVWSKKGGIPKISFLNCSLKVWLGVWGRLVVQLVNLSLPTWVEVELGCDFFMTDENGPSRLIYSVYKGSIFFLPVWILDFWPITQMSDGRQSSLSIPAFGGSKEDLWKTPFLAIIFCWGSHLIYITLRTYPVFQLAWHS